MRDIIPMVLVLGLTTSVSGLSLALVRDVTADRIAEQELKFIKEPAIRAIFDGLDNDPVADRVEIPLDEKNTLIGFPAQQGGSPMGVALEGDGKGYGGAVSVMVGVQPDGTIAGIGVTGHSETPGLGARCTETLFLEQFRGLPATGIATAADGGQVEAISGATITTAAVVDAVNAALAHYETHQGELAP
jgi:electron transport complex protein RnfG